MLLYCTCICYASTMSDIYLIRLWTNFCYNFSFGIVQGIALPGYFFTVMFIDRIGCTRLQLSGFFATGIFFSILATLQPYLQQVTNLKYSFLFIVATIIVITTDSLWLDQSNLGSLYFRLSYRIDLTTAIIRSWGGLADTQLLFIYVQCSRFNMMSFLHSFFQVRMTSPYHIYRQSQFNIMFLTSSPLIMICCLHIGAMCVSLTYSFRACKAINPQFNTAKLIFLLKMLFNEYSNTFTVIGLTFRYLM